MPSRRQIADAISAVAEGLGRPPTQLEFVMRAKIPLREVLRVFPKWNDAVKAAGFQPRREKVAQESPGASGVEDRITYGNPIGLDSMSHEPVNEQGVVLLFGMLAKDLGYIVEAAQKGFPDCEAKRRISPRRWERVRIEFEFESQNFEIHKHPVDGCDVIVCWRHNWPGCPTDIEVVELSEIVKVRASHSPD